MNWGILRGSCKKLIIKFRFVLGDSTDSLGKQRADLEWKLSGSGAFHYLGKFNLEGRGLKLSWSHH